MQHRELSFSKDKWLHDTLNLSCCLILEKQKNLMTAHSRVSIWKYTTIGKSFINTGNVLLAWISFSTPSLFISQLNEQLTAHISSVPAASPVTLVSANCRQMRVSLPGEMGGGEGNRAAGRGWEGKHLRGEHCWVSAWAWRRFWAKCCSFSVLCPLCQPFCFKPSQSFSI